MKKVLFSAIALAGLAAVIASPAQAEPSISGAAVNVSLNGNAIEAMAGQVVYPEGTILDGVVVTPTQTGGVNTGDLEMTALQVAPITVPTAPTNPSTIEAAIAATIVTNVVDLPGTIGAINAFK